MDIFLRHIETLVPDAVYGQEYVEARMLRGSLTERQRRYLRQLYGSASIDKRHSVISDFLHPAPTELFRNEPDGGIGNPGTAERNACFTRHANRMGVELADRALVACPGLGPADVTHVITVSCTGFSNPGVDYYIVRDVGLNPAAQRYQLGFMGCYAAIPALRMARQFCEADPNAVVMIVCIELCTLHLQPPRGLDDMLAGSLFADGAACAIVSGRPPPAGVRAMRLGNFDSAIIPQGEKDMAWTIGDHGFNIVLSSYVPKVIGASVRELVETTLSSHGMELRDVRHWAIHPGGKAIVDKVREALFLHPDQVAASHAVLRRFGNMSSATVLFVVRELWEQAPMADGDCLCAMAFGPGLTVEMGFLYAWQPADAASAPREASGLAPRVVPHA